MATANQRTNVLPPPNFSDPKASLAYLFDANPALAGTDTAAAEAAVAGGFGGGSPFGQNNRLRLRENEKLDRLKLGHELLNPFLNRESGERISNNQIQAQAASDAMRESGLNSRLSAEGQQRLQLALLQGDQQAADRLLTESGLDRRSSASLAAGLQESTQRNQTSLLQSLLPFAFGGKSGGGGGGGAAGGGAGGARTNDISTSNLAPGIGVNPSAWGQPNNDVPHWGDPNYAQANAGGGGAGGGSRLSGTLGVTLDKILRSYGLS